MSEFTYEGIDKTGKRVTGKIQAETQNEIRMKLRQQGVRPTVIASTKKEVNVATILKFSGSTSVPLKQIMIFTRQMQVLINSGIPLLQSLEILTEQAATPAMKNMLIAMREKVAKGSYFWEAIASFPNNFPKLYVSLIRAGESSGSLDSMLKRLSRYLEDNDRVRKMISSAMVYPVMVFLIAGVVVAAMLLFVIPKFESMLSGAGQELPLPTLIVIKISRFFTSNLPVIAGVLGTLSFFLVKYLKTAEGRQMRDRIFFRMPLFGDIIRLGAISRFARTMHTLLNSGINLVDAIEICRNTIDNVVLEEATARIRQDVENGQTLGTSISRIKEFPKMTYQMIQVGESTGSLDKMLEKIADFYEADVEALISGISKMLEPLILVFLGGTVGGLLIAMYLPIFKLAGGA